MPNQTLQTHTLFSADDLDADYGHCIDAYNLTRISFEEVQPVPGESDWVYVYKAPVTDFEELANELLITEEEAEELEFIYVVGSRSVFFIGENVEDTEQTLWSFIYPTLAA